MERVADELWTEPQSLKLAGIDIGTRMTVIRLGDQLLLHSPIRLDDRTAAAIDALGQVRWLVAPCAYHHLGIGSAKERWPEAQVIGVPGVQPKARSWTVDLLLPAEAPAAWSGVVDLWPIEGMPKLDEVAFLHRPSRTLVLTDFVFNLQRDPGWWGRTMLRLSGSYGGPRQSRLLRALMRDRQKVRDSRDRILAWDFDRVSVCHGELLEERAKDTLAGITAWI